MTPAFYVHCCPDIFFVGLRLKPNNPEEKTSMKRIMNFINDESGMETLEYALIAGLIAIVAVFVYTSNWDDALVARLLAATDAGPAVP
jgi:Flp pilus assembly pilin Flp